MDLGSFLYWWAAVTIFRHDIDRYKLIEQEKEYALRNGLPEPIFEREIPWTVWAFSFILLAFFVGLLIAVTIIIITNIS